MKISYLGKQLRTKKGYSQGQCKQHWAKKTCTYDQHRTRRQPFAVELHDWE